MSHSTQAASDFEYMFKCMCPYVLPKHSWTTLSVFFLLLLVVVDEDEDDDDDDGDNTWLGDEDELFLET